MTNDNNQITNNTAMGATDDNTPPPVSFNDYQETLGQMSHDEIVAQLIRNGHTKDVAEELANDFEGDRPKAKA
jgi:hypothetical protein